jgi:hypothetical protein
MCLSLRYLLPPVLGVGDLTKLNIPAGNDGGGGKCLKHVYTGYFSAWWLILFFVTELDPHGKLLQLMYCPKPLLIRWK